MTRGQVGLVQGSWDLFHIGHLRYLQLAREACEYLIVGVDSDAKIQERKGTTRPIIPYAERAKFIKLLGIADEVVEKPVEKERWALVKKVRPSVLIATEGNYTQAEIQELEENYCGEVFVVPRQATTSTSHRIREVLVKNGVSVYRTPDEVSPVYAKALVDGQWYEGRNLIDSTLYPEEIANRTELFYATVEHAEINCLKKFKGCPSVFAVSLIPCRQCLKALQGRGVNKVFYVNNSTRHWAELSKAYAIEHGVELVQITEAEFESLDRSFS